MKKLEQIANSFQMSVPAFVKAKAQGARMRPPKIDREGAFEIARKLRSIGVNVNQIAKTPESRAKRLYGAIRGLRKAVEWNMATIQLSTTKVANRLLSYAEKRAQERSGLDCPAEYAKSQFKATRELWGKKQREYKPIM
ncbi:hypothetical protein GCM10020331_012910 [Ectobacillus funiculus]